MVLSRALKYLYWSLQNDKHLSYHSHQEYVSTTKHNKIIICEVLKKDGTSKNHHIIDILIF